MDRHRRLNGLNSRLLQAARRLDRTYRSFARVACIWIIGLPPALQVTSFLVMSMLASRSLNCAQSRWPMSIVHVCKQATFSNIRLVQAFEDSSNRRLRLLRPL
jgi:hypothetical protein